MGIVKKCSDCGEEPEIESMRNKDDRFSSYLVSCQCGVWSFKSILEWNKSNTEEAI